MSRKYPFRAICMILVLLAGGVNAQTSNGKDSSPAENFPLSLREKLKHIPAAGAACLNENFVAAGQERSTPRPAGKADLSCAITLEQLSASLGKHEFILVDTRSKVDFDNVHIDGAVNFSASEIRSKRYLSDKFIVLLGYGKADQDLYDLCSELRDAGFKQTKVLRGGMLAWMLENRPVIGSASFIDSVNLSPGELFQESKMANNIIITLPGGGKLEDVLPMAIAFSSDRLDDLKGLIQKHKKSMSLRNVVLVADERYDKNQLVELAKAAKPETLLVYAGSEAAYRQFLHVQSAMWEKQAKGPNKPSCGRL